MGPLIPPIVLLTIIIIKWLRERKKVTPYTKKVVIMGTRGAGKTTLWKRLRGEDYENIRQTTAEEVKEFTIKTKSGREIRVAKTKDYSGSEEYITQFKDLIEDNTFVILLVDLNNFTEEAKGQILGSLNMIVRTMKGRNEKGDGLKLIATNFWKYSASGNKSKEDARVDVRNFLGRGKLERYLVKDIEVVDLRCSTDIERIKEEIVNS